MTKKSTVKKVPKEKREPKFWILWAPSSNKPPRIRFTTLEHVKKIADHMVEKYRMDVYVMQSIELHKLGKPEVVTYTARPTKTDKAKSSASEEFMVKATPPNPSNQGKSWDQAQDNELVNLWRHGYRDNRVLGERMGRSELAISYRLDALKLRRFSYEQT